MVTTALAQMPLFHPYTYYIRIVRTKHNTKSPDTLDQTSLGSRVNFILCLHKSQKSFGVFFFRFIINVSLMTLMQILGEIVLKFCVF